MILPCAVIAGRPNVGKSTLFNCLAGRRISIVDPTSGVTRDRVTTTVDCPGHPFELVDTGGIGVLAGDDLNREVQRQIDIALKLADVVLFVGDVTAGVLPADRQIADMLRRLGKPVILVANKSDSARAARNAAEFFELGIGEPIAVSALEGRGRQDLLDAIVARLPDREPPPSYGEFAMKLAIVGRRNVGKSTFVNAIVKQDRVIVSEKPGTTRDSIDVTFEKDGKQFIAIDTAGVIHKSKLADSVAFYSMVRAEQSIRGADVVLLLLESPAEIAQLDKRLARFIADAAKPCIIVVNKWDLAKGIKPGEFDVYLEKALPGLSYAPISFTSALTGHNINATIELAMSLYKQAGIRVPTAQLNKAIEEAFARRKPHARSKRIPNIYYATQVGTRPPEIVVFVNDAELFPSSYRRYVENAFRKLLPFGEIPIRIHFQPRRRG